MTDSEAYDIKSLPSYGAACSSKSAREVRSLEKIRNVLDPKIDFDDDGGVAELEDDEPRSRTSRRSVLQGQGTKKFNVFGKKTEWATMEDVALLNQTLREEIGRFRIRSGDALEFVVKEVQQLQATTQQLKYDVEHHQERLEHQSEAFTEACIDQLRQELQQTVRTVDENLRRDLDATQQLLRDLQENTVPSLSTRLHADIHSTAADLSAQAAMHELKATTLMIEKGRELDEIAAKLRTQCASTRADCDRLAEQVERSETLQVERVALQEARLVEVEARYSVSMERVSQSVMDLAAKTDELNLQTREDAESGLGALRELYHARVEPMEEKLLPYGTAIAEASGVPTRRVEWRIKDVSKVLLPIDSVLSPPILTHQWLSPKFHAAGAQDLQLELQASCPSSCPGSCDVSLRLWSQDGLQLVFKLYIGDKSVQMTHNFVDRSPSDAKVNSLLAEALDPTDDTLRVGVEIIEAVRTVEFDGASVVAPVCRSFEGLFAQHSELGDEKSVSLQGSIIEHRYLNHGTLDLVSEQVSLMQSRMTRRVEWKLEQAAMLARCFPEGESLCSSSFEAAGMHGLQLVFYPSGYLGAREGFCSFFLSCPSGSALRCWLSVGKQRREARVEPEQPGFLGRSNFCRLDQCIETVGDFVLLSLEIEEAQQASTTNCSHVVAAAVSAEPKQDKPQSSPKPQTPATPPCKAPSPLAPRDLSFPVRAATADPYGRSSPMDSIESVLKLQRIPGKVALEDVKQLPSIWTPKPLCNVGDVLEGYHKFSDIKSLKKLSGSARRPPGSAPSRTIEAGLDDDTQNYHSTVSGTASALTSRTERTGSRERDRPPAVDGRSSARTGRYKNKFSAYAA